MSQILILLRKSLLNFSRARAAIVITFVVPVVLILIMGLVFGMYGKGAPAAGIKIGVVVESTDPAATDLLNALKAEKALEVVADVSMPNGGRRALTEADARAAIRDNVYRFAVVLPADMVSDERFGLRIKYLTNPRNEIESQIVNGMLQKTIFSKVPQLLGRSLQHQAKRYVGEDRLRQFNRALATNISGTFGGAAENIQQRIESGDFLGTVGPDSAAAAPTDTAKSESANIFSRLVKIETDQIEGKEVKNPMAARIVGGYAIMFLLFAVSGSATSMFEEKATGIFQRLLASPVTPAHILCARFLFGVLLGIVQISALFTAGRIFFGLDLEHHLPALAAITIAAAAACSAFGILIAAVSPSPDAARGISTFAVITMSAVGGAWFPISQMPHYMQALSHMTITYWSVEGMTDVLWAGHSLAQILPKVAVLVAIAVGVMIVSIWRFNRNRFFE